VETFKKTARPHGTVTSSDAYSLGLIKSQTDFEVYVETGGMKGLDATFYVNRDKYHTMADTVANLNGRASLWSELQLVRDVGRALANLDTKDDSEKAVYWDSKFDNFYKLG
jgi:Peptidase family M28